MRVPALRRLQRADGALHFVQQARGLDGIAQLIRDRLQHRQILFGEGGRLHRLQGHRADGPATAPQWHRRLRARLRQVRVVETNGLHADIQSNPRLILENALANHRSAADFQFMAALQHDPAGVPRAGAQHGPTSCFLYQEQAHVVVAETLLQQVHGLGDQFLQAQDGRGNLRDFRRRAQLRGAIARFGHQAPRLHDPCGLLQQPLHHGNLGLRPGLAALTFQPHQADDLPIQRQRRPQAVARIGRLLHRPPLCRGRRHHRQPGRRFRTRSAVAVRGARNVSAAPRLTNVLALQRQQIPQRHLRFLTGRLQRCLHLSLMLKQRHAIDAAAELLAEAIVDGAVARAELEEHDAEGRVPRHQRHEHRRVPLPLQFHPFRQQLPRGERYRRLPGMGAMFVLIGKRQVQMLRRLIFGRIKRHVGVPDA
ncbi:MAG: hypothetical protein BWY25_02958 [Chloroflexi bacterium ADurb.Bin222]|nr:MAG: hypothetical protein BWY25_02958 [Chloroflexi bacterium ADurb.Bin222]